MAYKSIPLVNVSIIVKTWPGIPFPYASPLPIARSAPFFMLTKVQVQNTLAGIEDKEDILIGI
jgi:hypothetical protein